MLIPMFLRNDEVVITHAKDGPWRTDYAHRFPGTLMLDFQIGFDSVKRIFSTPKNYQQPEQLHRLRLDPAHPA